MMYFTNNKAIFWDFDGVIKDSVGVKSDAFELLFLPFGEEAAKRVRRHHENNGGMSRFDKIPIYLAWAGKDPTQSIVDQYTDKFSQLVKQKVIDSAWVDGIKEYLQENYHKKQFFLVTATPQLEIEYILDQLKIKFYFQKVIGSPISKGKAVESLLKEYDVDPLQALMVGDSISDYEAAESNHVAFVLRRTSLNEELQQKLNCKMVKNFL
ncbi:MAG: HAD family hydrolase [Bacteriovoracaceae bacterium]|nr:HAD family hydrolase [Bacteriovoracaceae bacterium]